MKHHITSFTGPFCPCPSRKGKQLELWAAQWLCLFWAEDGISSVGGSDVFLPCNMKHQLWLAWGEVKMKVTDPRGLLLCTVITLRDCTAL